MNICSPTTWILLLTFCYNRCITFVSIYPFLSPSVTSHYFFDTFQSRFADICTLSLKYFNISLKFNSLSFSFWYKIYIHCNAQILVYIFAQFWEVCTSVLPKPLLRHGTSPSSRKVPDTLFLLIPTSTFPLFPRGKNFLFFSPHHKLDLPVLKLHVCGII